MLKIVLASQSPRRKKLLNQLGLSFDVIPSTFEEIITSTIPTEVVTDLALQKAVEVAQRCEESLIIGADTIVVLDDHILGKPESTDEAEQMLSRLSSRTHKVYTGVAFVKTSNKGTIEEKYSFFEETSVEFSELETEEIQAYVKTGSPMDKAGSYGIQDDWGAVFVKRIEGDYYNVVGFPLNRFYNELKQFEPELLKTISFPNN